MQEVNLKEISHGTCCTDLRNQRAFNILETKQKSCALSNLNGKSHPTCTKRIDESLWKKTSFPERILPLEYNLKAVGVRESSVTCFAALSMALIGDESESTCILNLVRKRMYRSKDDVFQKTSCVFIEDVLNDASFIEVTLYYAAETLKRGIVLIKIGRENEIQSAVVHVPRNDARSLVFNERTLYLLFKQEGCIFEALLHIGLVKPVPCSRAAFLINSNISKLYEFYSFVRQQKITMLTHYVFDFICETAAQNIFSFGFLQLEKIERLLKEPNFRAQLQEAKSKLKHQAIQDIPYDDGPEFKLCQLVRHGFQMYMPKSTGHSLFACISILLTKSETGSVAVKALVINELARKKNEYCFYIGKRKTHRKHDGPNEVTIESLVSTVVKTTVGSFDPLVYLILVDLISRPIAIYKLTSGNFHVEVYTNSSVSQGSEIHLLDAAGHFFVMKKPIKSKFVSRIPRYEYSMETIQTSSKIQNFSSKPRKHI